MKGAPDRAVLEGIRLPAKPSSAKRTADEIAALTANILSHTRFCRSADWEGSLATATTGHDHGEEEGQPRALCSER